ncbi:hypothetical protein ABFS83_10G054300 [Erythranthe nasuta]
MMSSNLTRHRRSRQLELHLERLYQSVFPSVVALETHFTGPENRDLDRHVFHDTGVFVDPTTIVTSAKVVGRVFADKPAADGSGLHKAYLAHTIVISRHRKPVKTKLSAVSFSHDVAVLKLAPPPEGEEQISYPHCTIASSPPSEGHVLLAILHMVNMQFGMMPGHVRAVGEKTFKAKAPWPLDNKSGWMEFDNTQFNGGFPRPWSDLYKSEEDIVGRRSAITGSPLFNIDGELVGLGSWDVAEEGSSHPVGFAASLLPIMVAVEYAKNKKPGDPIVMDNWIDQDCYPDDSVRILPFPSR